MTRYRARAIAWAGCLAFLGNAAALAGESPGRTVVPLDDEWGIASPGADVSSHFWRAACQGGQ